MFLKIHKSDNILNVLSYTDQHQSNHMVLKISFSSFFHYLNEFDEILNI